MFSMNQDDHYKNTKKNNETKHWFHADFVKYYSVVNSIWSIAQVPEWNPIRYDFNSETVLQIGSCHYKTTIKHQIKVKSNYKQ